MNLNFYNQFHINSRRSTRIISDDDFTYGTLLFLLKKYIKSKINILDIGCGVGSVDFYLASLENNVTGIDISNRAIKVANDTLKTMTFSKNLRFKVFNFPKKLPNGKYNAIICSEVLEHLNDDNLAVRQMTKLLIHNGLVIASSPSLNAPLYKLGLLNNFDRNVGHVRRYSTVSFTNLFKNSGFKIIEIYKTEGVIRNFLFTNKIGGQLLRILNKWPFSSIVTLLDNLTIPIFGESNLYIVAKKI